MNREEIWNTLENKILPLVQKPGRYIGGEVNSVFKDLGNIDVRVALAFPDVYEIGMSNLGLKILYEEINSKEKFYAERVFSPWIDMEGYMRKYNIPLFSLETHSPVKEFDIVGFSLQYELCYTNVLNMLDLIGIPLHSKDRIDSGGSTSGPIVIAGGLMAYTPEPISQFIDLFIVGDGEEAVTKVLEFYNNERLPKNEFLKEITRTMDYVYAPGFNVSRKIRKNIIKNLNGSHPPTKPVVPLIEVVHERMPIEIMRGCPRNCRFCQAGILYKPVRKRDIANIIDSARESVKNTGYNEIGLLSLSSTDFGGINELVEEFLREQDDRKISISLPSMRVDSFSLELINRIANVKKTGITLAPEAATKKLLEVINKGYLPLDVINVAEEAFKSGYRIIKLYFMIGLPGEGYDDLNELISLLHKISKIGFLQVNTAVSTMIPKAHTPFQWMGMTALDEIKKKQDYIKTNLKKRNIKIKFHNPYLSILEAVFGRGDRMLGNVIYTAWKFGARFDQWEECFKYGLWEDAFKQCDIKMEDYLIGRGYDDTLPWDHIDIGVKKEFLIQECEEALMVLKD